MTLAQHKDSLYNFARFVVGLVSTRAATVSARAVATVAVRTGAAKLSKPANKGSGERHKFAVGEDGSLI